MTDLININKFLNNAIGFEDIFSRFALLNHYNTGFPYYNIKKNVTYVDILAEETVDEKIVKALRKKINIASEVMGEELKKWI